MPPSVIPCRTCFLDRRGIAPGCHESLSTRTLLFRKLGKERHGTEDPLAPRPLSHLSAQDQRLDREGAGSQGRRLAEHDLGLRSGRPEPGTTGRAGCADGAGAGGGRAGRLRRQPAPASAAGAHAGRSHRGGVARHPPRGGHGRPGRGRPGPGRPPPRAAGGEGGRGPAGGRGALPAAEAILRHRPAGPDRRSARLSALGAGRPPLPQERDGRSGQAARRPEAGRSGRVRGPPCPRDRRLARPAGRLVYRVPRQFAEGGQRRASSRSDVQQRPMSLGQGKG